MLTVTEPDAFKGVLQFGIGPAKAFGCGLMLVRRV
ncbi:MAG: type I-E CRISPR-associated protein Cas6/Cse3/CasE [Deltaproteobacteria bacterium]|nr:type I-E CRISPR-associated protein Cas6/Cse3/CasE [Deltaproteobacteria bacterium]